MPDQELTFPAMRKLDLSVHIATKLNRSHLLVGKETILLPCLGRTEMDTQASGPQSITVEDSMSMVHISRGKLPPASEHLRSEPAIIAGMAKATLPNTRVDWDHMIVDYDHIRDAIEAVVAGFTDYNKRIREPGGFRLPLPATERHWDTPSGRAQFATFAGLGENAGKLMLTTHPQPRSIQHDDLQPGRSLPRRVRSARRGVPQCRGSRDQRPRAGRLG